MHILLVEDDTVLADGLTRTLQAQGMQVEIARD
ncbi:MAG TPA: DNA-binding response regulator, partial [Massilia sp.]|nr:DNA-binding response regulator [Massilia sp.]